jgi:hypothetical protein
MAEGYDDSGMSGATIPSSSTSLGVDIYDDVSFGGGVGALSDHMVNDEIIRLRSLNDKLTTQLAERDKQVIHFHYLYHSLLCIRYQYQNMYGMVYGSRLMIVCVVWQY